MSNRGEAKGKRQRAYRRGRRAERLAAWWLRLKGYRILAQDYRCPAGEIDLIARRGGLLAFIEVKQRAAQEAAAEAISARQRRRIARAAEAFLQAHPQFGDLRMRFDAVLFTGWGMAKRGPGLRHEKDAWRSDTGLPY